MRHLIEIAESNNSIQGRENEANWNARELAILRVRGMLKGDVYERFTETFLSNLKPFVDASIKAVGDTR